MDNQVILLDGAMGTQLQLNGLKPGEIPEIFGLEHRDVVYKIHQSYIDAGSKMIYANTFGANRKKLSKSNYSVEEVIIKNVEIAKNAAKDKAKVALDIGPIGELLEPNGYLSFEEAYDIFKEMILAGVKANVDLVVFETMSDLMEVKAAILAAKENSDLDIFVTMSFEKDGRTFTGCCVESFALLCDRLHVQACGVNCSLGPDELLPLIQKMHEMTNIPLIVKANAGLPDPLTNTYSMNGKQFASKMKQFEKYNVKYMGGCCGSDPSFIQALNDLDLTYQNAQVNHHAYACTPTKCICLDDLCIIGERINPTGNKLMKQALLDQNMDAILQIALQQVEAGANMLDVNVGLAGIDEEEMMVKVIKALQEVVDVPLQIDSTNPKVIEKALRVYNGIASVNSINGELNLASQILPSIQHYGANVVGLTLDESGIHVEANKRYEIAKKIVEHCDQYHINKNRIFIDCLTLTVSAQAQGAIETLKAIELVKNNLQVNTVLGVSNISFGLPQRILINQSFLTMALNSGLNMPIMNPNQEVMMQAIDTYKVLTLKDEGAKNYIEKYGNIQVVKETSSKEYRIDQAILKGLKEETKKITTKLLEQHDPLTIVNNYLIPSLDQVGALYEEKKLYLPQLINAANAACCGFDEVKKVIASKGEASISKGKILLATVQGDVHDIGKNIVKVVLENYGYQVYDLGKDVKKEVIVEVAKKENIYLIGLSALMTTTLDAMKETIMALHEAKHDCKIMVGGAVVSKEYALSIDADYYAKDAKEASDIAKEVFACKN